MYFGSHILVINVDRALNSVVHITKKRISIYIRSIILHTDFLNVLDNGCVFLVCLCLYTAC